MKKNVIIWICLTNGLVLISACTNAKTKPLSSRLLQGRVISIDTRCDAILIDASKGIDTGNVRKEATMRVRGALAADPTLSLKKDDNVVVVFDPIGTEKPVDTIFRVL